MKRNISERYCCEGEELNASDQQERRASACHLTEMNSSDERSVKGFGPKKWVTELWDLLKTFVVAFIIVFLLNAFVFNLSTVKGQSMEPTLVEHERLFVDKFVYWFTDPARGDVVVLKDPTKGDAGRQFLVKRVVGVPGDTVEARDHVLYVNGVAMEESYTDVEIQDADFGPVSLGKDEYFVMGDNRHFGRSKDSRSFGSVDRKSIIGRAEFVFWPLSKIRSL